MWWAKNVQAKQAAKAAAAKAGPKPAQAKA